MTNSVTKVQNEKTTKTTTRGSKKGCRKKGYMRVNTIDTFWNRLRISNGFTYRDISEFTGIGSNRVANMIIGRYMPTDYEIKKFCDMFDVDFKRGRLGFEDGYSVYHNKSVRIKDKHVKITDSVKDEIMSLSIKEEPEFKSESNTATKELSDIVNYAAINELCYGIISYDDFVNLTKMLHEGVESDLILEMVYGKVDRNVYNEIIALLNDK